MRILYLFSGRQRKTSVATVLKQLLGDQVQIDEVDILLSSEHDMTNAKHRQDVLEALRKGLYDAVLITPPCSTWSRVRGANFRGPPMLRSREHVWGFPWLAAKHEHDASLGNCLVIFMIEVLEYLDGNPCSQRGWVALVWCEHPEDLGVICREEDGAILNPASIWQLERLRALVNNRGLFTLAFCQCCFRAPYRKPTRIYSFCAPGDQQDGPSFHQTITMQGRCNLPVHARLQ